MADVDESVLAQAVEKRAVYIREQQETLSLKKVRRLLEEDLELEAKELDVHRDIIGDLVKKVLAAEEDEERSEEDVDGEVEDSPQVQRGKKAGSQKRAKEPLQTSSSSKKKRSQEPEKKATSNAKPAYGRKVEQLRTIIKNSGLGIPPGIYKKVKQESPEKQEVALIRELEALLDKQGLSIHSSVQDMKRVRLRKEKEKDLEGIDMSNIVSEPRSRRATALRQGQLVDPPAGSRGEGEESDEEGEEDSEEDEDDEDGDGDDDASGSEGPGDESS